MGIWTGTFENAGKQAAMILLGLTLLPITVLADGLCVTTATAQLRKGPSSREQVTWTVGRYTPFIREDREGNWYKVRDLDGEIHYIHAGSVTQKLKCVAVRSKYARLKMAPDAKPPQQAAYNYAEKYVAFKLVDTVNDGYVVEDTRRNRFLLNKRDAWRPIKRVYMSF